ncbi:MAG: molybdopterin oxidoreductase family protein [Janthinobacterium lividum]
MTADRSHDTHCPYCALQCAMTVTPDGAGGYAVAGRDFPSSKGGLCRKGFTSASLLSAPGRLRTPLVRDRRGTRLREASWDEAMERVASGIARIQTAHGRDAFALFGGGGLTNEKAYLLGKFARVALGTAMIDYNGRFCMASAAAAGIKAFGMDRGLPFPLDDIPGAEAVLLVGGNPAETMPPIMQYFDDQRRRGGKLIVADPRRTATARLAHLHLQLTPGTDTALANGLLHVAMRDRLIDQAFIDARTTGWARVKRICASYWPDRVERITGVPAEQVVQAAHLMGEVATAMVLSARGTEQQSHGTENTLAFINLVLALGRAGKVHCGYGTITGQGNGQGGREHGQKADQLPGYRKLDNPAHRAEIAGIWGVDPDSLPQPGLSATELFAELGGRVKGLMVMAANPLVSAPDATALAGRMAGLDMLVVADMFLSETASRADVVLPIAQWAEEEGTMTNLEGRVIYRRQVVPLPDGVRRDADILSELAARLGSTATFDTEPRAAFAELRRASAGGVADYSGISYERVVAEDGVFWPCPSDAHPGSRRLYLERFAFEDGRARFHPVEFHGAKEQPDRAFPYVLTTGRVLSHYQSGAQTRRVAELAAVEPGAYVEMHRDTARGLGIAHGDWVRCTTRRGEVVVRARLGTAIRLDTVFVPFHWGGEGCANNLTNPALDPTSRMPEFKACAVHLERTDAPRAAAAPAQPPAAVPQPPGATAAQTLEGALDGEAAAPGARRPFPHLVGETHTA